MEAIERVEVDEGIAGGVRGAHGVGAGFAEELADGVVLEDEDGGPDEVGEEASPENDDEDGKVLPEVEAAGGEKIGLGEGADGLACSRPKAKKELMNAGEDGDGDALAEGVVASRRPRPFLRG